MKPRYIFSAVFAICLSMFLVLPQIANTPRSANVAAMGNAGVASANIAGANIAGAIQPHAAQAAAVQPTAQPTLPVGEQNAAQPAPTETAAPPQPVPTNTTQPPAPVKPNTDQTGNSLPSPADPAAAPGQGLASIPATSNLSDLASFTSSVSNGQASQVVGVYVPGVFAMRVVQQPDGYPNFVSTEEQAVTEYSRSAIFGVVGLLAHNTLPAGQSFYRLKPGQDVVLIYGAGKQVRYRIERVETYQSLGPTDPYSDFVDLNGPGQKVVRNQDLFQQIYEAAGQLVFQTCFEANGDPSWGRMFVIARPV